MCRIPVEVEYASEFRYRNPVVSDKDVLIAMSQSGETADTLAALELAKEQGAFVFGICNVIGSSIPRATDSGCYIHVGPEIGVASTKAFTGQVTVLAMMALMLGRMKGTIALIDDDMPTVVIAPRDKIYDKTVSNIQQIKARNGRIIALVTRGDEVAAKIADYVIEIPEVCECLSPILTSVPLQLLAYYVAVNKGRNVDQPRNLAKSVTVE